MSEQEFRRNKECRSSFSHILSFAFPPPFSAPPQTMLTGIMGKTQCACHFCHLGRFRCQSEAHRLTVLLPLFTPPPRSLLCQGRQRHHGLSLLPREASARLAVYRFDAITRRRLHSPPLFPSFTTSMRIVHLLLPVILHEAFEPGAAVAGVGCQDCCASFWPSSSALSCSRPKAGRGSTTTADRLGALEPRASFCLTAPHRFSLL